MSTAVAGLRASLRRGFLALVAATACVGPSSSESGSASSANDDTASSSAATSATSTQSSSTGDTDTSSTSDADTSTEDGETTTGTTDGPDCEICFYPDENACPPGQKCTPGGCEKAWDTSLCRRA